MVERSLSMREVPGSIPGASNYIFRIYKKKIFSHLFFFSLQLGQTVLHMVSITGESRLCALFCRADADVNLADDRRFRPLHWACVQGHKTVARILLNHGAELTSFNEVNT